MVTLKDFTDEEEFHKGVDQMEMMYVIGGLMVMMMTGLLLQYAQYARVKITVK